MMIKFKKDGDVEVTNWVTRAYRHYKNIGRKEFIKEFKQKKQRLLENPYYMLKQQKQGYIGVMIFSFISTVILVYRGFWFLGGVFVFNIWINWSQLRGVNLQIKNYENMERLSNYEDGEEQSEISSLFENL